MIRLSLRCWGEDEEATTSDLDEKNINAAKSEGKTWKGVECEIRLRGMIHAKETGVVSGDLI